MKLFIMAFCLSSIGLSFTVEFDAIRYSLEQTRGGLVFIDSGGRQVIETKTCNQSMRRSLPTQFANFMKNYTSEVPSLPSEYDVVVHDQKLTFRLLRGGHFGTWLRDLPLRFFYLKAESEMRCSTR